MRDEPSSAPGGRTVSAGGDINDSVIVPGDRNHVVVIYQGRRIRIPGPDAIQRHRLALRQKLEDDAAKRWWGMGAYIQEEGAHLPIQASPYQSGLADQREDLVARMRAATRMLVLGEPGSGKTVALERLSWELCAGTELLIPVKIDLLYYAGTSLESWVRSDLQRTDELRLDDDSALAAFLKEGPVRCFMLFDGLNEVGRAYRERFADELVRWMAAYPKHPIIITGRAQDELWRLLRERVEEALVIQPITTTQIVTYLQAQLGDGRGQALYDRLDERLRALAQRPLLLWMMKEAGAAGESLPGNRGELYARFVSRLLRRDTERSLDRDIPERTKLSAAAQLGYGLHWRDVLACSHDEAVEIVAAVLDPSGAEEVLGSLAWHGLLMGEGEYRFPHQTLQEHFAATALQTRIEVTMKAPALVRGVSDLRERFLPRADDLDALAREDWWTEPLIQLAGLVKDSAWLARRVARANPWLAWWCVQEGRAVDEATRAAIEQRSIELLRSADLRDRRRAVQALAQMGGDRTVDYLFLAAADRVPEIAALAVQALMQQGLAIRQRALALAQRPHDPLHRAGLACLAALLGQPVVYVPPGPFTMGSDPRSDPEAQATEQPQHTLDLPGYWIGRYAVTVAQFRAFVEDARHKPAGAGDVRRSDDHPVVNVTWDDALAYCGWLTVRTGLPVTLPSEAEWEKAARGTDERRYPWGNQPPTADLCNYEIKVDRTTPVGRYSPQGDSPYGCADMAGNVWEWTRSQYEKYHYDPMDGREDLKAGRDVPRVVRGGSFYDDAGGVRCAYRYRNYPNLRSYLVGFRLVVAPVVSAL